MGKKAAETLELLKVTFDFVVSMAKDVNRFLKEEKNASDYLLIADHLFCHSAASDRQEPDLMELGPEAYFRLQEE